MFFASSASNEGDFEIAGSQADLNIEEEDESPEGLKYFKPPRRTSYKKKAKGKTGTSPGSEHQVAFLGTFIISFLRSHLSLSLPPSLPLSLSTSTMERRLTCVKG